MTLVTGSTPAVCDAAPGTIRVQVATPQVHVRRLREDELGRAMNLVQRRLEAQVASLETVRDVLRHNPDSVWGIYRFRDRDNPNAEILGFYSMLLFNEVGATLLRRGDYDATQPQVAHLASPGERPAIVYFWALVAEGLTMAAGPLIARAMGKLYAGVPIYTTAGTIAGLKKIKKSGYRAVIEGREGIGDVFWLERYPEEQNFAHQTTPLPKPPVSSRRLESRYKVVVAATPDEMEKAFRIRAAVYMIEQRCPYDEEFDGNDYTGTTLLGYVDGEPAATMRVRYFADFVKFERLTVLPRFRATSMISRDVVSAAVSLVSRKGYRRGYGHAQLHAVRLWSRFGFRPTSTEPTLRYSDHAYVVMEGDFPAHNDPITMKSDPYLILRPEGRWDEPGILERSAKRPATNPH